MLATLTGFVAELRRAGLPVSTTECLDAARAVEQLPIERPSELKAALAATLVKSADHLAAFDTLFAVYFASAPTDHLRGPSTPLGDEGPEPARADRTGSGEEASLVTTEGDLAEVGEEELARLLAVALERGAPVELARVAALAVALYAGVEPGRPVGAAYYLARTLRGLGLEMVLEQLLQGALDEDLSSRKDRPKDVLGARLVREEYQRRAAQLERLVEAEILRRLVAERGAGAVAATLRRPLVEDLDVMHATREELVRLRHALGPLARVLAARLAWRRRHHRHGPLDVRATIRASMSTGGVPVNPRFRSPHPAKPELMVIADVSGSVAAFARFTLHLLYALDAQFSKVRSFVFIDGIDEITSMLRRSSSLSEALDRVAEEAAVTGTDGHSNYGSAFRAFHGRYAGEVGSRTNLLVLGDARNNYHASEALVLADLKRRARRLYWLNPEPRPYWGSGDSIAGEYAPHCDAMVECRTLRQLEIFIDGLR